MVCGIKTRPFENNPYRSVNLFQALLSTLGAFRQHRVRKFLGLVKLDSAIFAPIRIYRHKYSPHFLLVTLMVNIIVPSAGSVKNYLQPKQMAQQHPDAYPDKQQSSCQFHSFTKAAAEPVTKKITRH